MTLAMSQGAARFLLTLGVLAVWALGVAGMWWGWRRRVRRTALAPLPTAPEIPGGDAVPALLGVYLGTTTAGRWLDRVADQRLGERSSGRLRVLRTGVLVRRAGFDDLYLPASALRDVRIDTAHAGKVIAGDGMLVIGWHHGGSDLETGFRGDDRSRHREVADAVRALVTPDALPAATQEAS
jgi:hypothetical protein